MSFGRHSQIYPCRGESELPLMFFYLKKKIKISTYNKVRESHKAKIPKQTLAMLQRKTHQQSNHVITAISGMSQ